MVQNEPKLGNKGRSETYPHLNHAKKVLWTPKNRQLFKLHSVEKRTKGKGGKREGAGRPLDPHKEQKIRVYLPVDIADLLKEPGVFAHLRGLIKACQYTPCATFFRSSPGPRPGPCPNRDSELR